jgi:hypothetical protein
MAYTTAEGRTQLLADVAVAIDQLGAALAALTEAYERVDEESGDRLEKGLFRPVQSALGTARRTHAEFAARSGLPVGSTADQPPVSRPLDPHAAIEHAVQALHDADEALAGLQDSMLPVEVGDPELRAGLSRTRELIGPLPGRARELLRTLGR